MENIRRENLLFEAYLVRNRKEIEKEDDVSEEKKRKIKNLFLTN